MTAGDRGGQRGQGEPSQGVEPVGQHPECGQPCSGPLQEGQRKGFIIKIILIFHCFNISCGPPTPCIRAQSPIIKRLWHLVSSCLGSTRDYKALQEYIMLV
jgi:hypothetical protein